ncbi:hypothetical protein [Paenibacillus lutrae]|uniref:Uncharacterized protein n=1 Tax=Paenibacillus lutrae TaxID=2078573 RepID=A0A7X3FIB7_9BACL|nr:hypothetical protein [Paenibacillus lutrae]MVP00180.1 hypothetical protein [Paenibacillus lutrae]
MRRRWSVPAVVIAILAVIGLAVSIRTLLVPILVLGLIFLLYKFVPRQGQSGSSYRRSGAPSLKKPPGPGRMSAAERKRRAKFRVIDGSKRSDDPDDPPPYH